MSWSLNPDPLINIKSGKIMENPGTEADRANKIVYTLSFHNFYLLIFYDR